MFVAKLTSRVLLLLIVVLLSACSLPVMKLNKQLPVTKKYKHLGSLTIRGFLDNRPQWQKVSRTSAFSGQQFSSMGIIWSAKTQPSIPKYLEEVIADQAQKTGMFTLSKNGDYTIDGSITSAAVGVHTSEMREISPLIALFSSDNVTVLLKYYVVVRDSQGSILEKTFQYKKKISVKEYDNSTNSKTLAIVTPLLEEAVRQTVSELFADISKSVSDN